MLIHVTKWASCYISCIILSINCYMIHIWRIIWICSRTQVGKNTAAWLAVPSWRYYSCDLTKKRHPGKVIIQYENICDAFVQCVWVTVLTWLDALNLLYVCRQPTTISDATKYFGACHNSLFSGKTYNIMRSNHGDNESHLSRQSFYYWCLLIYFLFTVSISVWHIHW